MDFVCSDKYVWQTVLSFLSEVEVQFVVSFVCKNWKDIIEKYVAKHSLATAIKYAAFSGNLSLLQHLQSIFGSFEFYTHLVCAEAAKGGSGEVLEWATVNAYEADEEVYAYAAGRGDIEMIEFALRKLKKETDHHQTISREICKSAAENGHLHVLQWAKRHHYDFPPTYIRAAKSGKMDVWEYVFVPSCMDVNGAYIAAAIGKNIALLEWLEQKGLKHTMQACATMASYGFLEGVQYMRKLGYELSDTCTSAAARGHWEIVKWARANGCDWDSNVCAMASRWNNLEILKWAREEGCPWDAQTIKMSIYFGHHKTAIWALENGCEVDDEAFDFSAYVEARIASLSIDLLMWLEAKGYKWKWPIAHLPIQNGTIEHLKWALAHGCSVDHFLHKFVVFYGHLDMLEWVIKQGLKLPNNLFDTAGEQGHNHILKWAHNQDFKLEKSVFGRVARSGKLSTLEWAKEQGYDCVNKKVFIEAAEGGCVHIMKWAVRKGVKLNQKSAYYASRSSIFVQWAEANGYMKPPPKQ